MHAYQGWTNSEILENFATLVTCDRELTAEIIECLAVIEDRELHLGKGFTSLHGFCVEKFGFSDDVAFKRIRAARAVQRWPALLDHLRDGTLSLAAIVTLAPHLDDHPELIEQARGKSTRKVEALVAAVKPDARWPRGKSSLRPVGDGLYKLGVVLTQAQVDKLQEAQSLDRHRNPDGDLATLVESAIDLLIRDCLKKKFGITDRPRSAPAKSDGRAATSRKMPAAERRAIAERDGRQCTFVGDDGHRCESRDFVEVDHIEPFADGGESTADNGRTLCKSHNDYEARRILGEERVAAGRAHAAARRKSRTARAPRREPDQSTAFADADKALRHSGFSPRESADAVVRVARELPETATVEEVLRAALRQLMSARQSVAMT